MEEVRWGREWAFKRMAAKASLVECHQRDHTEETRADTRQVPAEEWSRRSATCPCISPSPGEEAVWQEQSGREGEREEGRTGRARGRSCKALWVVLDLDFYPREVGTLEDCGQRRAGPGLAAHRRPLVASRKTACWYERDHQGCGGTRVLRTRVGAVTPVRSRGNLGMHIDNFPPRKNF